MGDWFTLNKVRGAVDYAHLTDASYASDEGFAPWDGHPAEEPIFFTVCLDYPRTLADRLVTIEGHLVVSEPAKTVLTAFNLDPAVRFTRCDFGSRLSRLPYYVVTSDAIRDCINMDIPPESDRFIDPKKVTYFGKPDHFPEHDVSKDGQGSLWVFSGRLVERISAEGLSNFAFDKIEWR